MHADETPFRPGWWSFSLPEYRACDNTYCQFPYESLPPIDPIFFQGDFRWLAPLDSALEDVGAVDDERAEIDSNLPVIIAEAEARGVILPAAFLAFMRDPAAHQRIPSCTACSFDLPAHLTPSPFGDGGYLIRFLNDQQWVLLMLPILTPKLSVLRRRWRCHTRASTRSFMATSGPATSWSTRTGASPLCWISGY